MRNLEKYALKTQIPTALNTCAMIAVPFYVGGTLRGVLTCVKLKNAPDEPDPPDFTVTDLSRVKRLSSAIEHLLNYRILKSILDLEV